MLLSARLPVVLAVLCSCFCSYRQDSQLSLLWWCSFASRYAAEVLLCDTLRCFTAITDVAYCLACLPISAAMDVPFLANTVPLMGNAKSDSTLPMMCILPMHANQLLAASMSFQLHAARVLVTDRRQECHRHKWSLQEARSLQGLCSALSDVILAADQGT